MEKSICHRGTHKVCVLFPQLSGRSSHFHSLHSSGLNKTLTNGLPPVPGIFHSPLFSSLGTKDKQWRLLLSWVCPFTDPVTQRAFLLVVSQWGVKAWSNRNLKQWNWPERKWPRVGLMCWRAVGGRAWETGFCEARDPSQQISAKQPRIKSYKCHHPRSYSALVSGFSEWIFLFLFFWCPWTCVAFYRATTFELNLWIELNFV